MADLKLDATLVGGKIEPAPIVAGTADKPATPVSTPAPGSSAWVQMMRDAEKKELST